MGCRFRLATKIEIQEPLLTNLKKTGTRQTRFIKPDIVLPKHKVAIFVHGCFWRCHRGRN